MVNVPLSDLFHVKGRFRRSVHLERDFYRENAIDGYVLTATAREMLSRVISTLENGSTSKAWSLTGPYGSGKSAFALFAAKLLGNSNSPTTQQALELLERGDTSLYERFKNTNSNGNQSCSGFCPVLISGFPHLLLNLMIQRHLLLSLKHYKMLCRNLVLLTINFLTHLKVCLRERLG